MKCKPRLHVQRLKLSGGLRSSNVYHLDTPALVVICPHVTFFVTGPQSETKERASGERKHLPYHPGT